MRRQREIKHDLCDSPPSAHKLKKRMRHVQKSCDACKRDTSKPLGRLGQKGVEKGITEKRAFELNPSFKKNKNI